MVLIIPLKENTFPCIDARFCRTANVFAGWTIHHPKHPPRPDVPKMMDLESGGGVEDEDEEVAIREVGGTFIIFPGAWWMGESICYYYTML